MGQTKFCIFGDCEAQRRAVSLRYQFCPVQNSLYVQVLRSPNIGSVTARHSSSGRQPNCGVVQGTELRNFRRRRHLYSAGAITLGIATSAHILVSLMFRRSSLLYVVVRSVTWLRVASCIYGGSSRSTTLRHVTLHEVVSRILKAT